jgi:transcription elongation factor Elf1
MKLYPWDEVIEKCELILAQGGAIYQQFNCQHCGRKQTMDKPNSFYIAGICEECGGTTDIKKNGMNYMIHLGAKVK